jgi:hypothetical protein
MKILEDHCRELTEPWRRGDEDTIKAVVERLKVEKELDRMNNTDGGDSPESPDKEGSKEGPLLGNSRELLTQYADCGIAVLDGEITNCDGIYRVQGCLSWNTEDGSFPNTRNLDNPPVLGQREDVKEKRARIKPILRREEHYTDIRYGVKTIKKIGYAHDISRDALVQLNSKEKKGDRKLIISRDALVQLSVELAVELNSKEKKVEFKLMILASTRL